MDEERSSVDHDRRGHSDAEGYWNLKSSELKAARLKLTLEDGSEGRGQTYNHKSIVLHDMHELSLRAVLGLTHRKHQLRRT